MNTDEFFAEAKRLNLRVLGTPEETRAALDAKDAEIARLTGMDDAMRAEWDRECGDTDTILHALGLDPANCRTDGGSLKVHMIVGALAHRDVMTRRDARRKEIERCAEVIARKTHLPVTGDWDAGYVAGRDDAILAIRVTASNAALDDACPSGKCTDPARDCFGIGCLSDEPQSAVAAAFGGIVQTAQG